MLRADRFGVLLTTADGKLIECQNPCSITAHVLCITEGFQHPWCVSCSAEPATLAEADVNTDIYSKGWTVSNPGSGFTVMGGWTSTHSPYPEICRMRFFVFGVDTGMKIYPLGTKIEVAQVRIEQPDGKVFVNDIFAGSYSDFFK